MARATERMVRPATDESDQKRLHRIAALIFEPVLDQAFQVRPLVPLQPVCLLIVGTRCRYLGRSLDKLDPSNS